MTEAFGAPPDDARSDDAESECLMRPWEFLLFLAHESEMPHPTPVMLKNVAKFLSGAATATGKRAENEKPTDLICECKNLPGAIRRCLDDVELARSHPDQEEFRAQVFEVLCTLVEFSVAFLSGYVDDPANQNLKLHILDHVLEAISIVLDSNMGYYSLCRETGNGVILVLPSRLECALRVPGCVVKVFGATDDKRYYFCSQKGVNELGITCECCTPPSEIDGALANVYWQLANTASGNGYGFLLEALISTTQPSLQFMCLILRPFVEALTFGWRPLLQHLVGDVIEMATAYDEVFHYLMTPFIDKKGRHIDNQRALSRHPLRFDVIFYSRSVFVDIFIYLHRMWRWSLLYSEAYRSGGILKTFYDPGVPLTLFLERTVETGRANLVCKIVGEFGRAVCTQVSGNEEPFVKNILQWLKEKKVILNSLTLSNGPWFEEMIELVEFASKEGLVLQEEEVVAIINHDLEPERRPNKRWKNSLSNSFSELKQTLDKRNPHAQGAQVVATILDKFNLDPYTPESLKGVCNWLERWQAKDSVISSHTVCCILKKLIDGDKERKMENRLLNLLWKHASDLPASEFMDCLTRSACHYTSMAEPRVMIHPGVETEEFLQTCLSADKESTVACDLGIKFEDEAVCEQKARVYQDMEIISNFETSFQLKQVLENVGIQIPLSVHETSKECLRRLGRAHQLISDLKTTSTRKNIPSFMTSAVAPELQTLEAIKEEMALRPKLRQRMQEAQDKHLREYDALKQNHYKSLEKFFQDCLQEKEGIVREAIHAKAKVAAALEMANLNPKAESSTDDILTRVLQKAEDTLEEVGEEHRKSMEKVPNSECNVCFVNFISKRKRACFDPCGHTSTCIDCGMREWKKTKSCPLCKCGTVKPLAVPSMLFFG